MSHARRIRILPSGVLLALLVGVVMVGPAREVASQTTPSAAHVGSRACASCHPRAFADWSRSSHAQLIKAADSLSVLGDFGIAKTIVLEDLRLRLMETGGRYTMEIEDAAGLSRYQVEATLGNYALQSYLARMPDGRLATLPVVWDVQFRRWLGAVSDPLDGSRWDTRRWDSDCAACHAVRQRSGAEVGRLLEFGVGCESCHGPGGAHIAAREAGVSDAYPHPRTWTARARRDLCASCHAPGIRVPATWAPGVDLPDEAFDVGTVPLSGTLTPRHWPDGSERVPFASLGTTSAPSGYHASQGECLDCHLPHGGNGFGSLKRPVEDNALCADCHSEVVRDLGAHTRHRPVAESVGSRCVECHMPRTNTHYTGLLANHNFRSHEIGVPDPGKTVRYGMPNACNLCHVDRSPAWAEEHLKAPGGNGGEKSGGQGR